jgi:molybdopterin-guanine dinucleotide biosynthesis protein A
MKLQGTVGLVLCGGQSTRMARDKGSICYHRRPQREHVYHLLSDIFDEVYLSCNSAQLDHINDKFKKLVDLPQFSGNGPLGALLTAFQVLPGKAIMVVGCDYPLLTSEELQLFIQSIGDSSTAASFFGKTHEPALAWYSQYAADLILEMFYSGETSLRHFLERVNAHKYFPRNPLIVESIDTPAQSERVKRMLSHNFEKPWNYLKAQ